MGKQWKQWQTIFLGSKITANGDCSYEIKRCLLLGRKAMTNLDSILKSRDITLLTKLCLVKAMVFPVVMCGCEKGRSESEVSQSCPTLCDPMDCSLPGSSIHGIFQTTVLEWVALSFVRGSSQPRGWTQVSCIASRRFYRLSHQRSGCESWTIKKAERWRIGAFELWCWRRLLRVLWTARRSNQSILKEINSEYIISNSLWPRGLFI